MDQHPISCGSGQYRLAPRLKGQASALRCGLKAAQFDALAASTRIFGRRPGGRTLSLRTLPVRLLTLEWMV